MEADFVRLKLQDGVARVTLSRPEVHNAFNPESIRELRALFESLDTDDSVRAVILAGEGKSFCAGADIAWMKEMARYGFDENLEDAREMARMFGAVRNCRKPVMARVHGAAYGGGIGLLAACDMAFGVEGVRFCFSEVKLGIFPAVILPYVAEKTGPGPLRRYMLSAETFGAEEARRIGLLHELFPSIDILDRFLDDLVCALKGNGPKAVAACKELLRQAQHGSWEELFSLTTRRIAEVRVSPEGQEGLKAFLEKRQPPWAGSN